MMNEICDKVADSIEIGEDLHFLKDFSPEDKIQLGHLLASKLIDDIPRYIKVGGVFHEYYSREVHNGYIDFIDNVNNKEEMTEQVVAYLCSLQPLVTADAKKIILQSRFIDLDALNSESTNLWERWRDLESCFRYEHSIIYLMPLDEFSFGMECLLKLSIPHFVCMFSQMTNDLLRLCLLFKISIRNYLKELMDEFLRIECIPNEWYCMMIIGFCYIFDSTESEMLATIIENKKNKLTCFAVSFFTMSLPHSAITHPLWEYMVRIFSYPDFVKQLTTLGANLTMLLSLIALLDENEVATENEAADLYAKSFLAWLSSDSKNFHLSNSIEEHKYHLERFINMSSRYLCQSKINWTPAIRKYIEKNTRHYYGWQDAVDFQSRPHYLFSPLVQIYVVAMALTYQVDESEGVVDNMRWLLQHLTRSLPETLQQSYEDEVMEILFTYLPIFGDKLNDEICDLLHLITPTQNLINYASTYSKYGGSQTVLEYVYRIWENRFRLNKIMEPDAYEQMEQAAQLLRNEKC